MLKRSFILPFLILAYTIVLTHSIIPHHHHHELSSQGNTNDEEEHDDIDDNFLSQPFSFFQHNTGNNDVKYLALYFIEQCFKSGFYKEFIPVVDFLSIKTSLQFLQRPFPPEDYYWTFLFTSKSALFRGPPYPVA